MPAAAEEVESPERADEAYRGAVDWLLEATATRKIILC
jgi:hypothetical protein